MACFMLAFKCLYKHPFYRITSDRIGEATLLSVLHSVDFEFRRGSMRSLSVETRRCAQNPAGSLGSGECTRDGYCRTYERIRRCPPRHPPNRYAAAPTVIRLSSKMNIINGHGPTLCLTPSRRVFVFASHRALPTLAFCGLLFHATTCVCCSLLAPAHHAPPTVGATFSCAHEQSKKAPGQRFLRHWLNRPFFARRSPLVTRFLGCALFPCYGDRTLCSLRGHPR
jgi:hypothetical protein